LQPSHGRRLRGKKTQRPLKTLHAKTMNKKDVKRGMNSTIFLKPISFALTKFFFESINEIFHTSPSNCKCKRKQLHVELELNVNSKKLVVYTYIVLHGGYMAIYIYQCNISCDHQIL
jgi:hypothetical protein